MEAIYFGNAHWHGNTGAGDIGPWVGADLEQGMYYGGGSATQVNNQSKPLPHEFVSLYLRGRTDGFTLKGGDATNGTLTTMYDGPRPDREIAGTCGRGSGSSVTLQKCTGSANQTWSFKNDGKSIESAGRCLDIEGYATQQGAKIWAYPCGSSGVKNNEFWDLKGNTISSLQPGTPYCVGAEGTTAGSGVVLDDCTSSSSSFKSGFTKATGQGNIVQTASGLCVTVADAGALALASYQVLRVDELI